MTPQEKIERARKHITAQTPLIEARRPWYIGEHPPEFSMEAYTKTFQERLMKLIENQIKKVIDKRVSPLIPSSYRAITEGTIAEGNALWVSEQLGRHAEVLRDALRCAKWSGAPVPILTDYAGGVPRPFWFDPTTAWAELDTAGETVWFVWFWSDADNYRQVTVLDENGAHWFGSQSKQGLPAVSAFKFVQTTPNPLPYIPVRVVDEHASLVDELWPLNAALNTANQVSHILSSTAANPPTIWWGVQVLDPDTGDVTGPKPELNPATGSNDITIAVGADESGTARRVERLESRSPAEWEEVKRGWRQAIWSAGSVPASLLDFGQHPSADALETSAVQFEEVAREDQQIHDNWLSGLASDLVALRMRALGGGTVQQEFAPVFHSSGSSTESAKVDRFVKLVGAGVTIRDAAVRALGASPEEADDLQANADASSEAAVARAGQQFLAGI